MPTNLAVILGSLFILICVMYAKISISPSFVKVHDINYHRFDLYRLGFNIEPPFAPNNRIF
jgi:hypothetical protein